MKAKDLELPNVDTVGSLDATLVLKALRLRPVLMSEDLAAMLADRVEWGEPDAHGWYTPTFWRDGDATH